MNPIITYLARLFMDELIPPFIRDFKAFIYPLYWLWYKGDNHNIKTVMNFKDEVFAKNSADLRKVYERYNNLGSGRGTDAFDEDYKWVLEQLDRNSTSLLDVGCGNGFWLDHIAGKPGLPKFELYGLDISRASALGSDKSYICGEIETLPFEDKSFDVVTCFYVLEHIKNFNQAVNELKRIARRQLFLAVPCQRYNKYTFDLHVHFFYSPAYFQSLIAMDNGKSTLIGHRNAGHILFYANLE